MIICGNAKVDLGLCCLRMPPNTHFTCRGLHRTSTVTRAEKTPPLCTKGYFFIITKSFWSLRTFVEGFEQNLFNLICCGSNQITLISFVAGFEQNNFDQLCCISNKITLISFDAGFEQNHFDLICCVSNKIALISFVAGFEQNHFDLICFVSFE